MARDDSEDYEDDDLEGGRHFGDAGYVIPVDLEAVLGGILVGTCSTLLFVPFLYSVLRTGKTEPLKDYI